MDNNLRFNSTIRILDDLCKRLQDDYNCIKDFEQYEEDRLTVYSVIEILEKTKRFVDDELMTYACNDTLEKIQKYLCGDFEDIEEVNYG